jgi:hypothetical protein
MNWTNWYRTISPKPSMICFPRTKESLQNIGKNANLYKRKLRIITPLTSNTSILNKDDNSRFEEKEFSVSLDGLSNILEVTNTTIKVESVVKLSSIISKLEKYNLSLPNISSNINQSIFNIVSFAQYGSGSTGSISNFINNIEYVDINGNIISIDSTSNSDMFRALQTSLGCCALIYSFTLKCIPLQTLNTKIVHTNYRIALSTSEALQSNYKYLQIIINPKSESSTLFMLNSVESEVSCEEYKISSCQKLSDKILDIGKMIKSGLICNTSSTIDDYMKRRFKLYHGLQDQSMIVLISLFNEKKTDTYLESEVCINFKDFSLALTTIVNYIQSNSENKILLIKCRFVTKGTSLLDPAVNDLNVYLIFIMHNEPQYIDQLYNVVNILINDFNGRPGLNMLNLLTKNQLAYYGQQLIDFKKIRDQLDPQGLFLTSEFKQLGF